MNEKLINAIVGFEIPIETLEGKFKLGQNRTMADQVGALEGLEAAGNSDSAALAVFAREQLESSGE